MDAVKTFAASDNGERVRLAQGLPSAISHSDLGLFPGSRPLGKRSRRGRTPSYHGIHAGHKALGWALYESLLERDFQTDLCADPRVKAYAVQSHQLKYWFPSFSGVQTEHIYTPDVCVLLKDNRTVVFEVKHSRLRLRATWQKREPHIRRAYAEDHGVPFLVVTEREIRIQPRLSNYEIMLRHRHPMDDAEAEIAVRDALHRVQNRTHIGEVCDACLLRQNRLSRSYSALIRLALTGEIALDIDSPLSLATAITRKTLDG
ncbi:MAG: TnsA endonuclease N-terminal domain-containing protein [Rhizomicrobium sp.]